MDRNAGPACSGTGGRHRPEYALKRTLVDAGRDPLLEKQAEIEAQLKAVEANKAPAVCEAVQVGLWMAYILHRGYIEFTRHRGYIEFTLYKG